MRRRFSTAQPRGVRRAVSGGTFASSEGEYLQDNLIAFVVDGYEAVSNNDGTWTVKPYVTYCNEKGYTSLADAITVASNDYATAGTTVTLTLVGNVYENIKLPVGVVIATAGHSIDSVVDVRDGATIVETVDGIHDVTKSPFPPPVRSIVLNGDTVELRFIPRAKLGSVTVMMSTDLKIWSAMTGTSFTDNGIGKEAVVTAPKPDASSAFFKVVFDYDTANAE